MRRFINIAESAHQTWGAGASPAELENFAGMYDRGMGAAEHTDATKAASEYDWRFEPAYPLAKIDHNHRMDPAKWANWMVGEFEDAKEDGDGREEEYQAIFDEPLRDPITLVEANGSTHVVDGCHRVGAFATMGRTTIPAVVGTPKNLTEEANLRGVPESVVERYSHGDCMWLAVAMNMRFGWPIRAQMERDAEHGDYVAHAYCVMPDGREIDIMGPQDGVDIWTNDVQEWDRDELLATMSNDAGETRRQLADANKTIDLYIAPKLKETITESVRAPLYHFTTFKAAKLILADQMIKGSSAIRPYLSATRNRHLQFYNNIICLELDTDRIAQKYKIVPHDYWPGGASARAESEERVMTDRLPLSYVTRIILLPPKGPPGIADIKQQAGDEIAALATELNIPVLDKRAPALTEAFDSGDFTWFETHDWRWRAMFNVHDAEFTVVFDRKKQSDDWHVQFFTKDIDGWLTTTNTGEMKAAAAQVFGAVLKAVGEFLKTKKPPALRFSGNKGEGKANLYARMARSLASRLHAIGYDVRETHDGDAEREFTIYAPK